MPKKHLFISMLFFVFGSMGIAGATSMDYPPNILQDEGYKIRHDADDIDRLIKKISVLKSSHPNPLKKSPELNLPSESKPDILNRTLGGALKRWRHFDTFENGQLLAGHQSSKTNSVPEPATMLLLGSGLVVIAGLGRRKIKMKRKS
jgi:hypothetical protein